VSTVIDGARAELRRRAADYADAANSIGVTTETSQHELETAAIDFVRALLIAENTKEARRAESSLWRLRG
jgi:hypothetical protein